MSSKKIRKFVKKLVKANSSEEFANRANQLGSLACFILDNDPRYEELTEYFGKSVMKKPKKVMDKISYLLMQRLIEKHNDVFRTYKIVYALRVCGYTELKERIPFENVKFAWNLVEKADLTNDEGLFEDTEMLKGFSFD